MLTTKSGQSLGFGTELELGLRPKAILRQTLEDSGYVDTPERHSCAGEYHRDPFVRDKNRDAIQQFLRNALEHIKLPVFQRISVDDTQDTACWDIQDDPSLIESENDPTTYGIEIVSPIFDDRSVFEKQIRDVYYVLEQSFDIVEMAAGSTHIHVAPFKRQWTLQEVRLIGKGIIRLASALSAGVPDTDMITQWAAMNGNGKWLSIAGRQEAVQELEAIPCQEDKDKERDQLIQFLSPKRSLTWNFESLRGTGTVEMRRFPQSMTADASLHWIGLTLSMLTICLDQDLELSKFISMIEDSTGGSIDPPTGLHSLLTGGPLALFEDLVMESAELLGLEDLVKFEAGFWRDQSLSRFT